MCNRKTKYEIKSLYKRNSNNFDQPSKTYMLVALVENTKISWILSTNAKARLTRKPRYNGNHFRRRMFPRHRFFMRKYVGNDIGTSAMNSRSFLGNVWIFWTCRLLTNMLSLMMPWLPTYPDAVTL